MNGLIKTEPYILTVDEKSFTKFPLHGDSRYDSKAKKYKVSFYQIHLF